jgi:hypothetical protein
LDATSQEKTSTAGSSVTAAVKDWEAFAKADVSPAAKGVIATELSGFTAKGISEATIPFLTRAYLYEIRDRKGVPPGTYFMLDATDVKTLSPTLFVTQVALYKNVGYLKCASIPEGGDLTIDGKASGRTVREFVLSVGKHTVVTRIPQQQCEETVNVEVGQTAETRCPQK